MASIQCRPVPTKTDAIRRYRVLAAAQALIALMIVALQATLPVWLDEAQVPRFSIVLLLGAGTFVTMALATLGATWLIRRTLY
jgi:hypothetical protein